MEKGLATVVALVIAVTVGAIMLIQSWAIPVHWTVISYMSDHDATDTEMIRDLWPYRLIQPSWLNSGENLLGRWQQAEMHARIALIVILWFAVVAALLYIAFVRRTQKT